MPIESPTNWSGQQPKPYGASVIIDPTTGQPQLTAYGQQLVQEYSQGGQYIGQSKGSTTILLVIGAVIVVLVVFLFLT